MVNYTFVRHGATKFAESDRLMSISDIGVLQAKKCAELLRSEFPFDLAITSSALRTKETHNVILEQFGQKPNMV